MAGSRRLIFLSASVFGRFVVAVMALVVTASLFAFGISVAALAIVRSSIAPSQTHDAFLRTFTQTLPASSETNGAVSIFFAGDVMLDRTVNDRMRRAKDDVYPFRNIMTDERFTQPDLRVMNLEGPVTGARRPPEKTIDFQFDPRVIPVLNFVGWNGASQANNHALDQGRAGAEDSRTRLLKAGLLVFGHEVQDDEIAIATTTVHGRRLAFVGFNETSDRIEDAVAENTMRVARESADSVIVFIHWGEEYRDRPTRRQEDRAHWLIEHGADAVIGGHPHWVQGISSYRGKPIVYSLGNFVFDQDWSAETKRGLAVTVLVSEHETVLEFHPLQIDQSQPHFLDGKERDKRLQELAAISDAALTYQILQGRATFLASSP